MAPPAIVEVLDVFGDPAPCQRTRFAAAVINPCVLDGSSEAFRTGVYLIFPLANTSDKGRVPAMDSSVHSIRVNTLTDS